jgi:hypothetical protein
MYEFIEITHNFSAPYNHSPDAKMASIQRTLMSNEFICKAQIG